MTHYRRRHGLKNPTGRVMYPMCGCDRPHRHHSGRCPNRAEWELFVKSEKKRDSMMNMVVCSPCLRLIRRQYGTSRIGARKLRPPIKNPPMRKGRWQPYREEYMLVFHWASGAKRYPYPYHNLGDARADAKAFAEKFTREYMDGKRRARIIAVNVVKTTTPMALMETYRGPMVNRGQRANPRFHRKGNGTPYYKLEAVWEDRIRELDPIYYSLEDAKRAAKDVYDYSILGTKPIEIVKIIRNHGLGQWRVVATVPYINARQNPSGKVMYPKCGCPFGAQLTSKIPCPHAPRRCENRASWALYPEKKDVTENIVVCDACLKRIRRVYSARVYHAYRLKPPMKNRPRNPARMLFIVGSGEHHYVVRGSDHKIIAGPFPTVESAVAWIKRGPRKNPGGLVRLGKAVEVRYERDIGKKPGFYKHEFSSAPRIFYRRGANEVVIKGG